MTQVGDSFKAEIFVPVWTSQLFVNDWWQSSAMPLTASVVAQGEGWDVTVDNRTDLKLTDAKVAIGDSIMRLGEIASSETRTFKVRRQEGTPLADFIRRFHAGFQMAVQSRQRAFGSSESGRIPDVPNAVVGASFISQMAAGQGYMNSFIAPPGLDVSSVIEHGNAVVFAWAADYSPIKPIYHFSPRRSHRDTLWRVPVAIK